MEHITIANILNEEGVPTKFNQFKGRKTGRVSLFVKWTVFCADCTNEFRGKKRLKGRDSAYKCKGKKTPNIKCNSRGISIAKLETLIIQHPFISKDLQESPCLQRKSLS